MPDNEEYKEGYKYPYNSCEILCSENGLNINKLLNVHNESTSSIESDNININSDEKDNSKNTTEKEENNNIQNEKDVKMEDENMDNNVNDENINKDKEKNENSEKEENLKGNEKKEENIDDKKENDKKEENNDDKKENNEKKESAEENNKKEKDNDNKKEKDEKNDALENDKKIENTEDKNENEDQKEEVKMDIDDEEIEVDVRNPKEMKKELPNYPLVHSVLDHFFSFLDYQSSIENYVLNGYFNKITNYLIKTNTKIVLDYILVNNQNIINKLISHIDRYSIANIVINLLNALSENDTPEGNTQYMMIVNKLIEQFNLSEKDDDTIEIICDLFIESIIYNNKFKLSKIIEENIITKFEMVIKIYYENAAQNNNKILFVVSLLTKMNKSIISNFNNKITSTKNNDDTKNEMMNLIKLADKINNQFYSLNNNRFELRDQVYANFMNNFTQYCDSINNICVCVTNDLIQQYQKDTTEEIDISFSSKKIQKLGKNKIIKFEFINSVLDIYINMLGILDNDDQKKSTVKDKIKSLTSTNIFKIMIEYYFKYRNNNFYNNIIVDLIKIIFDNDKAPEDLILSVLQLNNQNEAEKSGNNNLITVLMKDIIEKTKFIFENTNNSMNNLLFASHIEILKCIYSSNNPYIKNICDKMTNEKFFYDNFVLSINLVFSKKLFKEDGAVDKDKPINVFDSIGLRLTSSGSNLGKSEIRFSLESLREIIDFYLKVNEKYISGEDYSSLFKEREEKLVKIEKSPEYLRLFNEDKEDELEAEEEEDFNDVDIPKPVFFNSKLDAKKTEENKNDDNNNNTNNSEDNNLNIYMANEDNIVEDKNYNDVNFWHAEVKEEEMEDILKDLL